MCDKELGCVVSKLHGSRAPFYDTPTPRKCENAYAPSLPGGFLMVYSLSLLRELRKEERERKKKRKKKKGNGMQSQGDEEKKKEKKNELFGQRPGLRKD